MHAAPRTGARGRRHSYTAVAGHTKALHCASNSVTTRSEMSIKYLNSVEVDFNILTQKRADPSPSQRSRRASQILPAVTENTPRHAYVFFCVQAWTSSSPSVEITGIYPISESRSGATWRRKFCTNIISINARSQWKHPRHPPPPCSKESLSRIFTQQYKSRKSSRHKKGSGERKGGNILSPALFFRGSLSR